MAGTPPPPYFRPVRPGGSPTYISFLPRTEGRADECDPHLRRSPTFKEESHHVQSPTASSFDKHHNAYPGDPLAKKDVRLLFTFVANDSLFFSVVPSPQDYWDSKRVFPAVPPSYDPSFHMYHPESISNSAAQRLFEDVLRLTKNIDDEDRDIGSAFDMLFGPSGMSSPSSFPALLPSPHSKHTLCWVSVCISALSPPPLCLHFASLLVVAASKSHSPGAIMVGPAPVRKGCVCQRLSLISLGFFCRKGGHRRSGRLPHHWSGWARFFVRTSRSVKTDQEW